VVQLAVLAVLMPDTRFWSIQEPQPAATVSDQKRSVHLQFATVDQPPISPPHSPVTANRSTRTGCQASILSDTVAAGCGSWKKDRSLVMKMEGLFFGVFERSSPWPAAILSISCSSFRRAYVSVKSGNAGGWKPVYESYSSVH
jgi:hypothetical protein